MCYVTLRGRLTERGSAPENLAAVHSLLAVFRKPTIALPVPSSPFPVAVGPSI